MFDEKFFTFGLSYRVNIAHMSDFLRECEKHSLRWKHGAMPTEFNPFKFYEGDKLKYIEPIQKVENRDYIYISCFNSKIEFSFEMQWFHAPYKEWKYDDYA